MIKIINIFIVLIACIVHSLSAQTCTSLNNVVTGNPKGWSRTTNWSCSGASSTVNGAWDGTEIVINRDFNIENEIINLTASSSITTIRITSAGNLIFSSNAQLLLPSGVEIIFESGARVTANNNASGSLIEINGNGVWGNACAGCSNSTLTGPGTIDETSNPNSPLPIELIYFNAQVERESVVLTWSTASEVNNDFFTIEKSLDGVNYQVISTLNGAGNNTSILSYSFIDRNPTFGRSYYRLKQTDFDGESETFAPKPVDFTSLVNGKLTFTNPVRLGETVNISVNSKDDEKLNLVVYSMLGEQVVAEALTTSNYQLQLNSNIQPGIYFIKVSSATTEQTGRLVIQ